MICQTESIAEKSNVCLGWKHSTPENWYIVSSSGERLEVQYIHVQRVTHKKDPFPQV